MPRLRFALAVCAFWLSGVSGAAGQAFEAALEGQSGDQLVRKGTALVTLNGNQLRVLGTFNGLASPWAQADIYNGDPDDGGESIINLALLVYDPQALGGGFDRTVTVDDAQLEKLTQNELYVTITTQTVSPETRLKGKITLIESVAQAEMETPLTYFFGGQPIARGFVRAQATDAGLRLVGFFNGLASNWQAIHVTKRVPGQDRQAVATIFGVFDNGLYLGFDHTIPLPEGWQADLAAGRYHVEIATSQPQDNLGGQLLTASNQAPPPAAMVEPTHATSFVVGGFGGSVDPDVYLGRVSIQPVVDPDGDPVAYSFQVSLLPGFNGTIATYDLGVDSTRFDLTVARAAEIFDYLTVNAEGSIPINSSRTLYFRIITTDGSRYAVADGVGVTFVRGAITSNEPDAELPTALKLHGNYPNPFNPGTKIEFDLATPSDVRVEVFDVNGRQVMAVPAGFLSAGNNQTIDVDAAALTSGIYLYRVVAQTAKGTGVAAGRMTLLK